MRIGNTELAFRPDRETIVHGTEDPKVRVLFSIAPAEGQAIPRSPVTVVVLLDCSGTVRRFGMGPEEAKRWIEIARERSELRVADSDQRRMYLLRGQTLEEARASSTCPLSVAAAALEEVAAELRDNDVCCLVGFATRAGCLYDGRKGVGRQSLRDVLADIQRDPSSPGLGDLTRMEEGARIASALIRSEPGAKRVRRLVIITDGIVEDQVESLRQLEEIRNEGVAVTTIGVGQEFDEEFLSRIADWTGGSYHYAAQAEDLERGLGEEFGSLHIVGGIALRVSARGLTGAVVNSVVQLVPQIRMFEEIRLRDDWFEVEVGDVVGSAGASFVAELSLPWLATGKHAVGELELEWRDPESQGPQKSSYVVIVECLPADRPAPEVDAEIEDMAMRLQVYRAERAAQWAQVSGRPGLSTVRLREASQILNRLGEHDLAERFEQQATDVEKKTVDSDRTKKLKDWVRRLGQRGTDQAE